MSALPPISNTFIFMKSRWEMNFCLLLVKFLFTMDHHMLELGSVHKVCRREGTEGFINFSKNKICSPGDYRPKYFMAQ